MFRKAECLESQLDSSQDYVVQIILGMSTELARMRVMRVHTVLFKEGVYNLVDSRVRNLAVGVSIHSRA